MSFTDQASNFTWLGFTHVIPLGYDHILFILSLFLLNSELKSVILQCTVFTIAHSLTLGLSAVGWIIPNSHIVEPLIAFSILLAAIENLIHSKINPWRLFVIFTFGLIHGMGFAGALNEIGIQEELLIGSILFFNIGVELAQITILCMAYFLVAKWFSKKQWYKERIVYPTSMIIACIAVYWTVERLMN